MSTNTYNHGNCQSQLETNSKYPQLNEHPTFKTVDSIYENRLRQFIDNGGQYNNLNLPKFYNRKRLCLSKFSTPEETNQSGIWLKRWDAPKLTKPLFNDIIPNKLDEFKTCPANNAIVMSPKWSSHWFQIIIRIDESWYNDINNGKSKDKNEVLTFLFDANCEAMVFDVNGLPLQGMTGGGERIECELPLNWFKISKKNIKKMECLFYLECGCNSMFGGGGDNYGINICEIVQFNYQAKALYYDFLVLSDAAREDTAPQKHKAREICNKIMDNFDPMDINSIDKCRIIAKEFLGENVDSSMVFKEKKLNKFNAVYALGNCHIDTAWLWDFATSKTKIARSWSSQLRLIEKYPEYVFVASAAQHFKWLVQYYPDLYKKVKKATLDGRFIPLGGSWVENDTNLPSGEGLVRQFLLGQRYFQNLFGVKSDIFWLPDSFGYSSQIPQICRLCEIPKFLTQKLSWNNINVFPQNSFNWVGIDLSQVMVHMPPDNTYTADANFGDVKRSTINHKNLYDDQKGMLLYGKGDGGGGPTPQMIEKLRRCRGYANTAGGDFPQVELGCTVNDFYNDLAKDTDNGKKLPSWRGELYLEYHRGTYTTQAKVKNFMRTVELLMHNVELFASIASISKKSYKYPLAKIESLWEDICLCQFHDVLPGSCINKVYGEDVWPLLAKVVSKETDLLNDALLKLGISTIKDDTYKHLIKLSSLPWKKTSIEAVKNLPNYLLSISQKVDDKYFIALNGSTIMKPIASKIKYPSSITKTETGFYILENSKLKASIDSNGVVLKLYDLINKREIINNSTIKGGNQYIMVSDTPLNFPAWDTELYSLNKFKYVGSSTKCSIKYNGPLVSALEIEHELSLTSKITTIISLEGLNDLSDISALKFKCNVSWNENYQFLKVQFPVNVSADYASYETQFGITKRPTHFNTSWDVAKFECCMHKFVDFSDYNYGVSLINNNKYGGSVHGNIMTLSLLRAPKYPDEKADIGDHEFSYEILPHSGPLGVNTVHAGWEFNERMPSELYVTTEKKDSLKLLDEFVTITGDDGVILSNVKRGEDDSDVDYTGGLMDNLPKKFIDSQTVVLRVYESLGGISNATIKLGPKIKAVFKTNLLEEEKKELKVSNTGEFTFQLRAFEIATFKVILA
ncbi:Glycoside hydrolase, 38 vacuolar alpha mannosidase [Pichia californica]|uniref:Alpha-mannosidase n=1 Tax=Pichia californica TaxID=460514 RepID=A0A9P6WGQ4_9ASCO|nr:Glycoside hydrolase, 38 vacuolar alpha mannosidase [[Candida] californica]